MSASNAPYLHWTTPSPTMHKYFVAIYVQLKLEGVITNQQFVLVDVLKVKKDISILENHNI